MDPNHNGLPEYPNFQIPSEPSPNTWANDGRWTAVIASPQSTTTDYAAAFAPFYPGATPLTINNQTITQLDFSTLSAGRITYEPSLVPSTGTVTLAPSQLTFEFNTYAWDGNITPAQTGDPRSNFNASYASPDSPILISPFSPIFTPYNDAGGAGNAQIFYLISVTNVTGKDGDDSPDGLTFTDGVLVDADLIGDLSLRLAVAPFYNPSTQANSVVFAGADSALGTTGTFSMDGTGYSFDLLGTRTVSLFSGINLVANRAGQATLVRPDDQPPVLESCASRKVHE